MGLKYKNPETTNAGFLMGLVTRVKNWFFHFLLSFSSRLVLYRTHVHLFLGLTLSTKRQRLQKNRQQTTLECNGSMMSRQPPSPPMQVFLHARRLVDNPAKKCGFERRTLGRPAVTAIFQRRVAFVEEVGEAVI